MAGLRSFREVSFPVRYVENFRVVRSPFSSSSYMSEFFETKDANNMVWYCDVTSCKHPDTGSEAFALEIKVLVCGRRLKSFVHLDVISLRGKSYNVSTGGLAATGQKIGRTMYIPQDGLRQSFTVNVKLNVFGEVGYDEPDRKTHSQFIANMASMLYSGKHSDVKVSVGKEEFAAHKAVLAARSPVFAAMFDHDFRESQQNRVTIADVAPMVFWVLLEFIYTNDTTGLGVFAYDLLVVADRYAIDDLKGLCESSLCRNVRIKTATKYLEVADLYRCEILRQHALEFICRNPAVLRTEAWRRMWPTRPDLVNEVLCSVMGEK